MSEVHPLIRAVQLKRKAVRAKAHPNIIKNLEAQIANLAQKSLNILSKSDWFVTNIAIPEKGKKFKKTLEHPIITNRDNNYIKSKCDTCNKTIDSNDKLNTTCNRCNGLYESGIKPIYFE